MKHGFCKVSAAAPAIRVADPLHNAREMLTLARAQAEAGVALLVFPELSLVGYTAGDLLLSDSLLAASEEALAYLAKETADLPILLLVGAPVRHLGRLYNAAVCLCRGRVLGAVPKTRLCDYGEFAESRYFSAPPKKTLTVSVAGQKAPLFTSLLFVCEEYPTLRVAAEICEDLFAAAPPSAAHAAAGATVVGCLCASPEFAGQRSRRRQAVCAHSAAAEVIYVLANSSLGESTTDAVFAGGHLVAEVGKVVAEQAPFDPAPLSATVDTAYVSHLRLKKNQSGAEDYAVLPFSLSLPEEVALPALSPLPFVEEAGEEDILLLQAHALATRVGHTRSRSLLLGLSGGLDSALAALVCAKAADLAGLSRKSVYAVGMPCFGTTQRTAANGRALAESLGLSYEIISVKEAVEQHFRDIGQDADCYDVVYENCQARERTQVLMDLANKRGGLVVGTGDLSELALGFATYGGDQMSMYGVNASVPKTLMRHILAKEAKAAEMKNPLLCRTLLDIVDTPISPELLPTDGKSVTQSTEQIVGHYDLHDFFLWHMLKRGAAADKLYRMACHAFAGVYEPAYIEATLLTFLRRFVTQQFKRSAMPDGPKVTSLSLSPRAGFRMPSDASLSAFLPKEDTK